MTTQVSWYEAYKSAVFEPDRSKIEEKIQAAENGISARLHEFSMNHVGRPKKTEPSGCSERIGRSAERCCCVAGIATDALAASI